MTRSNNMDVRYVADPVRFPRMNTDEVRASFLVDKLFTPDKLYLLYCDVDRDIVGSAVPGKNELKLEATGEIAADYFCQRREIGVLNIGGTGDVSVDGQVFSMENRDGLYIGKGSKEVVFTSKDSQKPAQFYLVSLQAPQAYPS